MECYVGLKLFTSIEILAGEKNDFIGLTVYSEFKYPWLSQYMGIKKGALLSSISLPHYRYHSEARNQGHQKWKQITKVKLRQPNKHLVSSLTIFRFCVFTFSQSNVESRFVFMPVIAILTSFLKPIFLNFVIHCEVF